MTDIVSEILISCNFGGIFNFENLFEKKSSDGLPLFGKTCPASYILKLDCCNAYYAVILYDEDQACIFNPRSERYAIPCYLLNSVSTLTNVSITNMNIQVEEKDVLGTCIYFIYHCFNNMNQLSTIFPKSCTPREHKLNLHDFLKVKAPFHKW